MKTNVTVLSNMIQPARCFLLFHEQTTVLLKPMKRLKKTAVSPKTRNRKKEKASNSLASLLKEGRLK
jgi:hypothetical protein